MEIPFVLSLFMLISSISILKMKYNLNMDPKTTKLRWVLFARGSLGGLSACMFTVAQGILPPQKMSVLNNTNVIFVVILSPIFIKEIPNLKIILLVIISFFGIILIVDPALLEFWGDASNDENTYPFYAYMFALQSGLGGAAVTILLRAFGITKSIFFNYI